MKQQHGFTLIELLVYFGLTGILITILSQVFLSVVAVRLESGQSTSVQLDGRYIMARLAYDIRRAQSIAAPSLGQTQSGLTLSINENGTPVQYAYSVVNGVMMLTTSSSSARLSSSGSKVATFSAIRIGNSATITDAKDTVQLNLWLESSGSAQEKQTLNLTSSVGLR